MDKPRSLGRLSGVLRALKALEVKGLTARALWPRRSETAFWLSLSVGENRPLFPGQKKKQLSHQIFSRSQRHPQLIVAGEGGVANVGV